MLSVYRINDKSNRCFFYLDYFNEFNDSLGVNMVLHVVKKLFVYFLLGILGPWILSNKSVSVDNHPIKLTSRRTLLEIVDEGLYLIYIQVIYFLDKFNGSKAYCLNRC